MQEALSLSCLHRFTRDSSILICSGWVDVRGVRRGLRHFLLLYVAVGSFLMAPHQGKTPFQGSENKPVDEALRSHENSRNLTGFCSGKQLKSFKGAEMELNLM